MDLKNFSGSCAANLGSFNGNGLFCCGINPYVLLRKGTIYIYKSLVQYL